MTPESQLRRLLTVRERLLGPQVTVVLTMAVALLSDITGIATDYVRVGAPLQLLLAVVVTLGIAVLFGV